jgi:hypothetical protein
LIHSIFILRADVEDPNGKWIVTDRDTGAEIARIDPLE